MSIISLKLKIRPQIIQETQTITQTKRKNPRENKNIYVADPSTRYSHEQGWVWIKGVIKMEIMTFSGTDLSRPWRRDSNPVCHPNKMGM